jgi:DNA polymerase V
MEPTPQQHAMSAPLPFVLAPIHAGFPSPADEYAEQVLDLSELVIQHKEATFFASVKGNSMHDAGIYEGDILVIDRAVPAAHGSIVVAMLQGEFTIKRLSMQGGDVYLLPANPAFQPIKVTEQMEFQVWGVVTYCVHRLR